MRPGFVLSILLHVLFVAIFLLPLLPAPPQAKLEQSVNVELVPQQQEKQELATKANEKPDQPPKPTQKPDDKPAQQTAEAQQEPQQPQGKKSDEQPPKQSDPQAKEQAEKPAAKSAEAKADKPEEQAEKRPSAAEKPADAKSEPSDRKSANPEVKQAAAASPKSTANSQEKEPSKEASSSPKEADTPSVENATLSPRVNDSQPLEESTASATTNNNASSVAEQAAENDKISQLADSMSPNEAFRSQSQSSASTVQSEPHQSSAISSTSHPSDDTASTSKPELLATDLPSETEVDPQEKRQLDQTAVGTQAETKANTNSDAPQIALPGITTSGQPQVSHDNDSSGTAGEQSGTGLIVEPMSERRREISASKPNKGEQKTRVVVSGKMGAAASAGPFIQAKRFYSANELARLPKGFLAQWKELSIQMRMSQLCNAEGAAQLNAAGLHVLRFGLPSASENRSANRSIETDKAVYRTSDGYRYVGVKCGVDAGAMRVVSFAYRLGASIPQDQWKSLNLPTN
ncbi:Putative membrane spanning protein, required for outer membrane integrity [Rhizobium freirei PRF 81]|uniref:Putative membrane spanning protein, required for outer membrane integrity n=1 Tax=Rhizobium freirei PRF 81 TaxID=363754 RepID=N6UCI2_9HYPH|nr:DUF930 domain-containing protein [Rhizobium freirei]ENN87858.1 Putative membrane spanning protein, required for outer membrane integrity [Rhizobium freirei PRF 81]